MSHKILSFGSLGPVLSTQWKGCGYAHITNPRPTPKNHQRAWLVVHTNQNSTTNITITHDDWTCNTQTHSNNQTSPLSLLSHPSPYPSLLIATIKNHYSPPFWYSPIQPLHHNYPPYSSNSPQHSFPSCITYPAKPTPHTNTTLSKIPKHDTQPCIKSYIKIKK